jgi:hypothetical protein
MKKRQIELTIQVFNSFEEAEKSQREYWWSLPPLERLKQAKFIREINYGRDDSARRLPRFFEVVKQTPR